MPLSNRAKSLAAICIGLGIAFVLTEAIGRLVPLDTGFQTGMSYTRFHPVLGFEIDPDIGSFPYQLACLHISPVSVDRSGRRVVPAQSRNSQITSNETLRIAVLGDSFMMGREVADGEDFAAQLSRTISNSDVMNFGVPGYGTIQALLNYKLKVSALKPDITILGFLDVNDVVENSAYLSTGDSTSDSRPFFAANGIDILPPRENRSAAEQSSFSLQKVHQWMKNTFFSYHMLYEYGIKSAYKALRREAATTTGINDAGSASVAAASTKYWWQDENLFRHLAMYQREPDEQFEAGWRATERALLMLRDAVTSDGGRFVLMLISAEDSSWVPPTLKNYAKKYGEPSPPGFDLRYPAERLRQFAQDNGIDVIDLGPVFATYRDRYSLQEPHFHYRCDGHWSPLGHYVAAQSVAQHLAQQGIVSESALQDTSYMEKSPQEILGDAASAEIFGWGKVYRGGSATALR